MKSFTIRPARPEDIFFSADGTIEVLVSINYSGSEWALYYQPTDPGDYQYIIK